jgi:MEMO1 family protein
MTNTTRQTTRQPAVAGMFYPSEPATLRAMIEQFLHEVAPQHATRQQPKAIIAPHAGYIYSGPIAASAYACLQQPTSKNKIKRVAILAPAHRYPVAGLAVTLANYYATPLGKVKIDVTSAEKLLQLPFVEACEEAFDTEHAAEVQIPFLQIVLKGAAGADFAIIPILVGGASAEQAAAAIKQLWDGDETLIIISSDLSHYYSYTEAQALDTIAAKAIEELNPTALEDEMACGHTGIRGLLLAAKEKKLRATTLDLRNSGDTAGDKAQVVGYGAFHIL